MYSSFVCGCYQGNDRFSLRRQPVILRQTLARFLRLFNLNQPIISWVPPIWFVAPMIGVEGSFYMWQRQAIRIFGNLCIAEWGWEWVLETTFLSLRWERIIAVSTMVRRVYFLILKTNKPNSGYTMRQPISPDPLHSIGFGGDLVYFDASGDWEYIVIPEWYTLHAFYSN